MAKENLNEVCIECGKDINDSKYAKYCDDCASLVGEECNVDAVESRYDDDAITETFGPLDFALQNN